MPIGPGFELAGPDAFGRLTDLLSRAAQLFLTLRRAPDDVGFEEVEPCLEGQQALGLQELSLIHI